MIKMKKTIKINFRNFGEVFNPEDNFFTNILRKKYNVKISKNPDYLFYSIYLERKKGKNLYKYGESIKKISLWLYIWIRKLYSFLKGFERMNGEVPSGNFVKIFVGFEYTKPNMEECDWAFSSYPKERIDHPKHLEIPMYMTNDYQLKNFGVPPAKRIINMKKVKKEKTRFCNFIYSQEIPKRNDFFKELNKYKRVDAPGRCMNNMHSISHDTPKNSRISENWVLEKLNFIKKYKFTIAFENSSNSGWITEKLTHPFLVNSIPIYFGHKDVEKNFNSKSFLNFNDYKNMNEFIKRIIEVDQNDKLYEKYLREPVFKGGKIPEIAYEERILKRFKEIFG
ncbi:MAG TPA: hypothetical protein HA284_02745 [Nanoarchaeota archaeon]|nr:hypothetical protein [Nanoarchaeota archaeon]